MKQIENWKKESAQSIFDYVDEVVAKDKEWRDKYGYKRYGYVDYKREVPKTYLDLSYYSKADRMAKIEKMVEVHYEKLQAKVINKIGAIKEIQSIGTNGHDYIFKGENGTCMVEVIGAGGYNIQRYHTRWIIK